MSAMFSPGSGALSSGRIHVGSRGLPVRSVASWRAIAPALFGSPLTIAAVNIELISPLIRCSRKVRHLASTHGPAICQWVYSSVQPSAASREPRSADPEALARIERMHHVRSHDDQELVVALAGGTALEEFPKDRNIADSRNLIHQFVARGCRSNPRSRRSVRLSDPFPISRGEWKAPEW